MPLFKVELQRRQKDGMHRNPFLIHNIEGGKATFDVRAWEFEADSEDQARQLLDDAFKAKLPFVAGFELRSITEL